MKPTSLSRHFCTFALFVAGTTATLPASADWYYYVMKVVCTKDALRIIDYSAYNDEGEARGKEIGVIDVDKLSTWKSTRDGLNLPDKPRPYIATCRTTAGKYRVVLTNAGGGYSAPYPVINVREISKPKHPVMLIKDLDLDKSYEYKRFEILFNRENPRGHIIEEKECHDC